MGGASGRGWARRFLGLVSGVVAAVALSGAAAAGDLPAPTGEVVLTVKGRIAVTNAEDGAVLDIAALEAMGPVTVETSTIWTDGVQTFRGVPLATLLDFLGAEGEELIAHALNDYSVSIPLEDAVPDGPIVAFEQNGRRLSVRDKGPLWIVYPYDRQTDYQSEVIYARSIWQLAWIEVK